MAAEECLYKYCCSIPLRGRTTGTIMQKPVRMFELVVLIVIAYGMASPYMLRENCLQRVKKSRSQLLWRIRLGGEVLPISREEASLAFSDILVDEIDRLRQRTNGEPPHAQTDPDAMLWEYQPSEALLESGNDDYEELMIAMQNILYEDLRNESKSKESLLLEEFEKSCEQEDRAFSVMLEQLQNIEA
ncbi:hypothetical protein L7F22_032130 [Adiantum nelumboides]|nr:hypothetical protein [Adiantum nelumboides]